MAVTRTGPIFGLVLSFALAAFPVDAIGPNATSEDIDHLLEDAENGSLYAQMQLGIAYDLGWGAPLDKAEALRWYREAAEGGDPDGQFNLAVMYDAGLGSVERDAISAATWYTRAAANGMTRAQYNLGLMYESGDGIERNIDLAMVWFQRAAEKLPAAKQKLDVLKPEVGEIRRFVAPKTLFGGLVEIGGGLFAELVWTAVPGPVDTQFLVEVVGWDPLKINWSRQRFSQTTDASGVVSAPLPNAPAYAWRVSRVELATNRYAASPWQQFGASSAPFLPDDTVPQKFEKLNAQPEDVARELLQKLLE
ncbi:MAG: tetratricopeptide repeat protein [Sulfitobacter sp.]